MGVSLAKIRENSSSDEIFRQMCLYYSDLLAEEGVKVRPFISPELPTFSKLPEGEKKSAIEQISTVLEVFEEVRADKGSLRDSHKLTWRALARLGWVPAADVFSYMEDGDIICFHDTNQRMVFQNLNFFDWVSYTLEDLYGGLWYTHSKREEAVAQKLYEAAVDAFSGVHEKSFEPDLPEHVMEEVNTEEMLKFWIKVKCISPLKSKGQVTGLLLINRCRWVE